MAKFELKVGKYTTINEKTENYYYFVNEKGQIVNYMTLRPYRGKKMEKYAMKSKVQAMAYIAVINKEY